MQAAVIVELTVLNSGTLHFRRMLVASFLHRSKDRCSFEELPWGTLAVLEDEILEKPWLDDDLSPLVQDTRLDCKSVCDFHVRNHGLDVLDQFD